MHTVRRSDREITKIQALEVLKTAEYGVLSTVGPDNQPYGVPVSYCLLGESIYFHCAVEGHKIDNFSCNQRVSFCVVGNTRVLPEKFSTEYESTILFGTISEAFDLEKQQALEGLVLKYSRDYLEKGLEYIAVATGKTRVFKISIDTITGKSRR